MNKFLEAALKYQSIGLSVIPLSPGTKVPPKDFEVIPYRTRKASIEEIQAWWRENPRYNVGIVTGNISDLAVVDFDKYKPAYSEEIALSLIPDTVITATAITPRGGVHHWFRNDASMVSKNSYAPAVDFKAELSYIVAPPSLNGNGHGYVWVDGLSIFEIERGELPLSFKKALNNNSTLYRGLTSCQKEGTRQGVTSVTKCDIWADGTRDENLFHVALCLTKTDNDEEYIRQTLRAIILSWGERDEKWIDAKIKSAFDRSDRAERNLAKEIDEWISVTERDWCVTQCDKELHIVTKRDMATRRKHLSRRKDVTIEKVGSRDGWWRRIDTDIEVMDFSEDEEGALHPILLPFDLHNLVKIYDGNIILVSGEFNSGKSLFALTTLVMNKNRMPIRYMSSEMKVPEIKGRFRFFGIDKECYWPDKDCKYIALRNNLTAAMIPDGLNIIDYMEFPGGEFFKAGEYLKSIHDKLNKGIALVCVQHKVGAALPRSGDLALEKPRLALALRKIDEKDDNVIGVAQILKAKSPKIGKMDDKKLKYEIRNNGSRFKTLIDWGYWKI